MPSEKAAEFNVSFVPSTDEEIEDMRDTLARFIWSRANPAGFRHADCYAEGKDLPDINDTPFEPWNITAEEIEAAQMNRRLAMGEPVPGPRQKETTMSTTSEPITWTTGPGKQTARKGDREARLTKGGLYWYAEGQVDGVWGARSLGADREVARLKMTAEIWLDGEAAWERHQCSLGYMTMDEVIVADDKKIKQGQIALDTLRQPAKK